MSKQLGRSARAARIAEWLNTQRGDVAPILRLEINGDEEMREVVSTWTRPRDGWDCEAVAVEADRTIQNVAEETSSRVTGRLALYTTEPEKFWTGYSLRAEPVDGAQSFDGSTKNLLIQNQKHLEAMGMGYARATEAVLKLVDQTAQTNTSIMKVLTELVTVREQRGLQLEQNMSLLRDENSDLRAAKTEAETIAESVVEQAEEAAKQVEELRKKGTEDAEIFTIVKNALAANNQEKPAKRKKASE